MKKVYATIIGSREVTPIEIERLEVIAEYLARLGYVLRSGGAEGSDSVVTKMNVEREIILPWNGFNNLYGNIKDGIYIANQLPDYRKAQELAKKIHPAPQFLKSSTLALHTRNMYQITGTIGMKRANLSKVVVYAAKVDENLVPIGGTRTAVQFAKACKIPCYNMRYLQDYEEILHKLEEYLEKPDLTTCEAGGCDKPAVTTKNDISVCGDHTHDK